MNNLTTSFWIKGPDGKLRFRCPDCGGEADDHDRDCEWTIDDPRLSKADVAQLEKGTMTATSIADAIAKAIAEHEDRYKDSKVYAVYATVEDKHIYRVFLEADHFSESIRYSFKAAKV